MSCNEWKEYELEDIIETFIDYRGRTPKKTNSGIPLITAKIVKQGRVNPATEFIKEEDYDGWMTRGIPLKGDVILTTEAPLGEVAQIKDTKKVALAQRIITLRGKVEIVDNTFLKYSLQSPIMQHRLFERASGTTVIGIKSSELKKVNINLPPLEEQKKIANVLSSLDDKIELNNEMNKTLEEMAESIFKRWFVDFEFPNEDGEPYQSSGGEMVDSELGMIPKGWEVQCIGDIGNVITGKTPSAKVEGSYGDECNFITPRDITDSPIILNTERKLSSIGINNLKKNLVCKNSIGVSCIGSNLGEVYITGENSITNQQINTVVLDESHIYPYIYIYLKNMKNEFLNMAGGSAVPIINKTSFSGINILMPDMYILNKFVQSTTCYFERIEENLKENESLIALRDNLLPKLMSGEIDLSK